MEPRAVFAAQSDSASGGKPAASAGRRVLIADDHEMLLDMFRIYIAQLAGVEIVTAATADAALGLIAAEGPFDLVLLDLKMPGMEGLNGLLKALAGNGGKPVGIVTGQVAPQMAQDIMDAGSAGIILKSVSGRSLLNAIRFMLAGETYLPLELHRWSQDARQSSALHEKVSEKEGRVLVRLAEGLPNKQIARDLGLAEVTVKMHVGSICRKLGVKNRTQAVIKARDLGLI